MGRYGHGGRRTLDRGQLGLRPSGRPRPAAGKSHRPEPRLRRGSGARRAVRAAVGRGLRVGERALLRQALARAWAHHHRLARGAARRRHLTG